MKKLKLFFALFAMLALNVGNAWAEEVIANFGWSNWDGVTASFSGNAKDEVTQTVDGVVVTYTRNGASLYANNTALRFYKSNTLKFDAPSNYSITSITFACTAYKTDITTNTGTCTATSSNLSWSGDATSVTFTRPSSASSYATITGATVTLLATGGGENPGEGGGEEPTPDPEEPSTGTSGEVTFVFDTDQGLSELGIAKPNASAGTNLGSNVYTKAPINMTATDGGTATRVWNSSGATTLRVYKSTGSLTFSSEATINKIVFNTSITATASVGSLSGMTWTGEAKEVKITFTANATIKTITVAYTVPSSGGGSEEPAASLTANPTSLDFGNVTQNNEVEAKTFTISGSDFTTGELTITAPSGYTVNPTTVSVDGTLGETTITVTPNTSTVGTFNGNVTISGANLKSSVNVALTMTVEKAPATPTDNVYVKVTSTEGITNGEYLIVYEDETAPVAFDGNLATLDAISNSIAVTISNNTIAGDTDIDKATFTIASLEEGFSIQSKSGYYIGQTSDANGLASSVAEVYENTLSIEDDGSATIQSSGACLRYNSASNQLRFRYYKSSSYSGQKPIALYKKASEQTVTIADCTNGSVSAKMGETALATNDQVLSGIQITLSNEAATGYKLAAYDVYKTDDATTKVTVTDGKFIMPEFDVTISATFELAKTLTSIEITTPATQTTFWQNETFNHNGLKVIAHFDGAADEDVTDKVTVNGSTVNAGTVSVEVSFTEGSTTKTTNYDITVKATANGKETAYDVATAREIIDKVSTADNVYVTGIVSEIVTAYDPTYGNISYNISADGLTTSDQLQAFRGKSYNGENFTSADDIQVGDEVVVFGNLLKYSSTYELNAGNQLVDLKRDRQQAGLIFAQTELTAYVGEEFTEPELTNPNGLSVEYSTSDATLATVDETTGDVTIGSKVGTVTITASFAGNETYLAGNASYNIKITDPNQLEATFVAGTDKSDTKSISKNGITVTFTDGTFSRDDNYRCYAGKEMTISYDDGNITKIVFTCDGSSYGPDKFSTETVTYSYSGSVGTWVGDVKSVTFAASSQVRMKDITVYYKQDKRANAELAWSEESVSLTVGDAFTAPTFNNPNNVAPISFKSDNTNLATVNNAGAISLKAGAVGTATITASFAGNETYKDAEVKCTISVSPKTENVVILAQYAGKWYALKAEYVAEKTDRLVALPVEYINGTLYNVADADKALITWERVVIGNKATFKNGDNYLKGKSSTTLIIEGETTGLYQWDYPSYTMVIEGSTTVRTFLYNNTNNCFRNYDITNASDGIDEEKVYSALPVVTAAKFENATIITRSDLSAGNFGTICYENNITNFTGATFYEVAGKEGRKVIFDEVTELVAGMPYIFRAEAAELKIVLGQENTTTAGQNKSLQGTFEKIEDGEAGEAGNTLEGNYIIYKNFIKKCGAKCGLLANRAYFIADALNNLTAPVSPAPGRKRVSMDVLGENEATGVDNITENGVIAPAMQGTYDVLGRQLSEPTATGFYIVNGKKVFVVK